MSPTIVAAIIAGSVAIIAPIITLLIKEWIEQKPFSKISGRQKALIGMWRGSLKQAIVREGTPAEMEITIKFIAKGKKILGSTTLTPPGFAQRELGFIGGFLHEQFVKLDYSNPDPTIMQFGCYVARLDVTEDQKVLDGRFVGYGPDTKEVVYGTALLKKVA
jgi:hypothetical protein